MEKKKTDSANLELRRVEMFLVALVVILSGLYVAMSWDSSLSEAEYNDLMEEAIENIDFDLLKKNNDMVAAISNSDMPEEVTVVKPGEAIQEQPQESTVSQLLVGDGESEVPEATVEEARPQVLDNSQDKNLPEGFRVVEQLPEFPGGASAFMKWITANLKYPREAQAEKIEGKVVVSFIVDAEGNVTRLKVERSPNPILTSAVRRTMERMPKWKPGLQNGEPCATMVSVPINFDL